MSGSWTIFKNGGTYRSCKEGAKILIIVDGETKTLAEISGNTLIRGGLTFTMERRGD